MLPARLVLSSLLLLSAGRTYATVESCVSNPELYKEKSAELERIVKEDQADRSGKVIDWPAVSARDLQRRIQVAAIFAQGCFKQPKDYSRAALVFQHGDSVDHYYQAFIWANTALKMGDRSQRSLVAVGIDRYLVKIGHRQLFGSQFSKDSDGLWCIEAVEATFPEAKRIEYLSMNLQEHIAFFLQFYQSKQRPEDLKACVRTLKPSPVGTVPGFW